MASKRPSKTRWNVASYVRRPPFERIAPYSAGTVFPVDVYFLVVFTIEIIRTVSPSGAQELRWRLARKEPS